MLNGVMRNQFKKGDNEKLNIKQAKKIFKLYISGKKTQRELAKEYKVDRDTIARYIRKVA